MGPEDSDGMSLDRSSSLLSKIQTGKCWRNCLSSLSGLAFLAITCYVHAQSVLGICHFQGCNFKFVRHCYTLLVFIVPRGSCHSSLDLLNSL